MLVRTVGEEVVVTATFRDAANQPMAVTGVAIKARAPGGAVTSGTVQAGSGTGQYLAEFALTEAGSWRAYAECSGPSPSVTPTVLFRAVAKSF